MEDYRFDIFDIEDYQTSHILMVLSRSGYFVILPEPFDIDNHLKEYPIDKYFENNDLAFDKVKLKHILGLLSSIPAFNKDIIVENGYVPIHAKTIRDYFKDYLVYIDYLIDSKIIESDNHYIPSEKSIGYRWTSKYWHVPFVSVSTENFKDYSQLKQIVTSKENPLKEIDYLKYWYQCKALRININKAKAYAYC